MATTEPTAVRNLDGYNAPIIEWSRVLGTLDDPASQAPDTGGPNRHTAWLTTVNPDGRPHVVPLGAVWIDGAYYFTSGDSTRKSKNLAADARCSVSIATHPYDLVVEGTAAKVTDDAELQRLADEYSSQGWKPTVRDGAFVAEYSAPSAGPPPWYVWKVTPRTVYAFGTAEPYGATRFDVS